MQSSPDIPVDGLWAWLAARASLAAAPLRRRRAMKMARAAGLLETRFRDAGDDELRDRRLEVAAAFRRSGLERGRVIEGLALVREACRRHLGQVPYEEQ